ncbi:MAG: hypothetical protein ACPG5B_15360 [Chitinophagales bacterium]
MQNKTFIYLFFGFLTIASLFTSCKKDPVVLAETLECDAFASNTTLINHKDRPVDYIIDCEMEATADIVIEAGVVIEFSQNAGIEIEDGGSLKIEGNADEIVTLTGVDEDKGSWKGLLFDSNNTNNQLKFVDISYAGGGAFNSNNDEGSIIVWADAKLSMESVNVKNSAAYGLNATYVNSEITMNNCTFRTCDNAPIMVLPAYIGFMNATNSYSGNAKNYVKVEINTDEIKTDMTIEALDVPYRITSNNTFFEHLVIAEGTTTINTDVVMEFEDGTGLYVDDDGGLSVQSSGQVTFTGVTKTAGAWKGLYFQFTQKSNLLDNVLIEYAGSDYEGTNQAIGMWSDPKLALSNVTFKDIQGCAIIDYNNTSDDPNPNYTATNNMLVSVSDGEMCFL